MLSREVLSVFWVLGIGQCFKAFLVFMFLLVSSFKIVRSKVICKSIRGHFVGFGCILHIIFLILSNIYSE